MYCSTCGAEIPDGRRACSECGTPTTVSPAHESGRVPTAPDDGHWAANRTVAVCPRCGYHGDGISYFSRGSHLALLIGATVMTVGIMGAGGLIYFLMRHDHRVCPRCGKGWGKEGELSVSTIRGETAGSAEISAATASHKGSSARGWSIVLMILAAVLMVGGIAGEAIAPILLGVAAGGGAWALHRSARAEREARRAALISSLQLPVLKLARERFGRLTVTDVAAELGWTLPRAEKVLESLNDGYRVSSDVTDEGVIVYEFLELRRAPPRLSDGGA